MDALKGLRLTAAPGPDLVLRQLLIAGGLDPERDVQIVPVPGSDSPNPSGVIVARALEEGQVDGFWANAMGSETIVQRGVGKNPSSSAASTGKQVLLTRSTQPIRIFMAPSRLELVASWGDFTRAPISQQEGLSRTVYLTPRRIYSTL